MKKLLSILAVAFALIGFANLAHAEDAPKKSRVKTDSGVIYEVTTTKDATTGAETSTITAVFVQVTNSATNTVVELPVSSSLVGSTVTGVTSTSAANMVITPPGSTTPLTGNQVAASLNSSVNVAVQTAVQSGTIPPTTSAPVITAGNISSGTVSLPPTSTPGSGSQQQQQQQQEQQQQQQSLTPPVDLGAVTGSPSGTE